MAALIFTDTGLLPRRYGPSDDESADYDCSAYRQFFHRAKNGVADGEQNCAANEHERNLASCGDDHTLDCLGDEP